VQFAATLLLIWSLRRALADLFDPSAAADGSGERELKGRPSAEVPTSHASGWRTASAVQFASPLYICALRRALAGLLDQSAAAPAFQPAAALSRINVIHVLAFPTPIHLNSQPER
jgi:hypothetical protein